MTTLTAVRREAAPLLARIGFTARGIIYLLIGAFTAVAAFRADQPTHGFTGALDAIAHRPLGGIAIVVLAAGLACFAGWLAIEGAARCVVARGCRNWLLAIGMLGDAVLYAGFVIVVLGLAFGWHSGGESELHRWVGWFFAQPLGRWLVGIGGAGMLAGGVGLMVWALTKDVEKPLALSADEKDLTRPVSRYGVTGRGVALALIGFYLIAAAIDAKPSEAHELGGLLQHLRQTAHGWIILLLFALAFGASAFFDFLGALYRRVGANSSAR